MECFGKDDTGRRYYRVRYSAGCLKKLPWGGRRFDCGIFVHRSAVRGDAEQCIQEVVRHNNDWVCTYGADAEMWHDRIDQASVEIGRQQKIGDGSPMTAWFGEIVTLRDLDLASCFGAYPFLLILVGVPQQQGRMPLLECDLRPIKTVQATSLTLGA